MGAFSAVGEEGGGGGGGFCVWAGLVIWIFGGFSVGLSMKVAESILVVLWSLFTVVSGMPDDVVELLGFMRTVGFELLVWSSDSKRKSGFLNTREFRSCDDVPELCIVQ